jgi:hypothetical protein
VRPVFLRGVLPRSPVTPAGPSMAPAGCVLRGILPRGRFEKLPHRLKNPRKPRWWPQVPSFRARGCDPRRRLLRRHMRRRCCARCVARRRCSGEVFAISAAIAAPPTRDRSLAGPDWGLISQRSVAVCRCSTM